MLHFLLLKTFFFYAWPFPVTLQFFSKMSWKWHKNSKKTLQIVQRRWKICSFNAFFYDSLLFFLFLLAVKLIFFLLCPHYIKLGFCFTISWKKSQIMQIRFLTSTRVKTVRKLFGTKNLFIKNKRIFVILFVINLENYLIIKVMTAQSWSW